jgi:hypothetical protein
LDGGQRQREGRRAVEEHQSTLLELAETLYRANTPVMPVTCDFADLLRPLVGIG